MRRMYSEQELTKIVKDVMGTYIEEGVFDEDIEQAVLDYIAENPIDPTAITGLDIAPKDVTASGNITGASIIENMSGYSFIKRTSNVTLNIGYAGVVKNGNKITFAVSGTVVASATFLENGGGSLFYFIIPASIGAKLIPSTIAGVNNVLSFGSFELNDTLTSMKRAYYRAMKSSNTEIDVVLLTSNSGMTGSTYYFRYEETFLLSDSLAS